MVGDSSQPIIPTTDSICDLMEERYQEKQNCQHGDRYLITPLSGFTIVPDLEGVPNQLGGSPSNEH